MPTTGWKNYPYPDAVFSVAEPTTDLTVQLERLATIGVWLAWGMFVGGALFTLAAPLLIGWVPWGNYGIFGMVIGWFMLAAALWFYRGVMQQRAIRERDFLPAITDDTGASCLFMIFVSIPVGIVGFAAGLAGTIAILIERGGKEELGVRYILGGRIRRRTILVPKASDPDLKDDAIVWITRPRLFVPALPIDRFAYPGILDHASYNAKEWFAYALGRADERRRSRRSIIKRAKRIKQLRHDQGQSKAYS